MYIIISNYFEWNITQKASLMTNIVMCDCHWNRVEFWSGVEEQMEGGGGSSAAKGGRGGGGGGGRGGGKKKHNQASPDKGV